MIKKLALAYALLLLVVGLVGVQPRGGALAMAMFVFGTAMTLFLGAVWALYRLFALKEDED